MGKLAHVALQRLTQFDRDKSILTLFRTTGSMGNDFTITVVNNSDQEVFIEGFHENSHDLIHDSPLSKHLVEKGQTQKIRLQSPKLRIVYNHMHYLIKARNEAILRFVDDAPNLSETEILHPPFPCRQGGAISETPEHLKIEAGIAVASASVVGGVLAPVATVAGIQAIGFGAGGVIAGSTAAGMMSTAGSVAAGSSVAVLQSIGALGTLTVGPAVLVGLLGAAVVGGIAFGSIELHEHLTEEKRRMEALQPHCWNSSVSCMSVVHDHSEIAPMSSKL